MSANNPRVDAYIAKSADFAQPILHHLRSLVHKACPDVEETIKWGFPHFEYKGILCSMASFKQHCTFGFWKASVMKDPKRILSTVGKTSMGHFGRMQSMDHLPPDNVLVSYIKEAVRLNEDGIAAPAKAREKRKPLPTPSYLKERLKRNPKAAKTFASLSPSCKREYIEWITETKTELTRNKRLATTIDWLSKGRHMNWKYAKRG